MSCKYYCDECGANMISNPDPDVFTIRNIKIKIDWPYGSDLCPKCKSKLLRKTSAIVQTIK